MNDRSDVLVQSYQGVSNPEYPTNLVGYGLLVTISLVIRRIGDLTLT